MKKNYLAYCIFLFLCFSSVQAREDFKKQDSITVKQMQRDIDFFFTSIKDGHPYLYEKYPKIVFDSIQRHLRQKCNKMMSVNDFIFELRKNQKIFDEHTGIRTSTRYDTLGKTHWLTFGNDKAFLKDYEVKSIGGVDMSLISNGLDDLVNWTHNSDNKVRKKNALLTYYLCYEHALHLPYICRLYDPKTKIEFDSVFMSIKQNEPLTSYDKRYHNDVINHRTFEKDSIAIFYYNTSQSEMSDKIDSLSSIFFNNLSPSIRYLFIDVSQNYGGSDNTHNYLYRYLKAHSFEGKMKSYITERGVMQDANIEINASFKIKMLVDSINSDKVFKGRVFVIMGANTFSAGHDFCEMAKRMRIGYLVGETTGQRCNYTANNQLYMMPESKINFACPSRYDITTPSIANREGFLDPDIKYSLNHCLELDDYKCIIQKSKSTPILIFNE